MSVRELGSQEAQHDSGAILRSAGREAMQLEYGGHTLTLDVDRGVGRDLFYLSTTLRWDDGAEVPRTFGDKIPSIIREIEQFWGSEPEFRTLSR